MIGDIIGWDKCKREFIRKVEVDLERIESLKKLLHLG